MIVNGAPQPFDAGLGAQAAETFQSLSAGGYRTLGVAVRKVDQQDIYTLATEHDMTLAGFAALLDPPKGGSFRSRGTETEWRLRGHHYRRQPVCDAESGARRRISV